MFYLTNELPEPVGYVTISETEPWGRWLAASIPLGLHRDVRNRLMSNLKHILVGLEMKAALVIPHQLREQGHSLLFEPYAQILHFEFCTGVFSVCEGLGCRRFRFTLVAWFSNEVAKQIQLPKSISGITD